MGYWKVKVIYQAVSDRKDMGYPMGWDRVGGRHHLSTKIWYGMSLGYPIPSHSMMTGLIT